MLDVPAEIRVFIVSTVYALLGMVLLFVGYRVFDWLTPNDMQKKIFEEGNVAVAILAGSFIIGLAIVILSGIHG